MLNTSGWDSPRNESHNPHRPTRILRYSLDRKKDILKDRSKRPLKDRESYVSGDLETLYMASDKTRQRKEHLHMIHA